MLGAKAEEGSGSATGSNIWARSRRLLCLAGAPEGPVETSAMGGWIQTIALWRFSTAGRLVYQTEDRE